MDALEQSACIFELILADIRSTYPERGGGGITEIRQTSTTTFTASISQEERVDLLEYEIEIAADGKVAIAGKQVNARTK